MKTYSALAGVLAGLLVLQAGCVAPPVGADKTSTTAAYRQLQGNAVGEGRPSLQTRLVLQRFNQKNFTKDPDATLQFIHQKAIESGDRSLLFALSELSYLAAERLRHNVKAWDLREPRDYYLASAVYAWFFLFGDGTDPLPGPFDNRFRSACDLYNFGLGRALIDPI